MKILHLIAACLLCITGLAQTKEKAVLLEFLSDTELLVVYKPGLITVFNVPDLSIAREFSAKDSKFATGQAHVSPGKNRLVTADQKLDKRTIWNMTTGAEIASAESKDFAAGTFLPDGTYVMGVTKGKKISLQVFDVETGSVVGDLDNMGLEHSGIAVSPSGNYLVNYSRGVSDVQYAVYKYKTPEKILANKLGTVRVSSLKFNAKEDSIKFFWTTQMTSMVYYENHVAQIPVGNPGFNPQEGTRKSDEGFPITTDDKSNAFRIGKDIMIPIDGKDYYSFVNDGRKAISPGNKWVALVNGPGTTILIFDLTDTEPYVRKKEQFRKPREAGKFISPK